MEQVSAFCCIDEPSCMQNGESCKSLTYAIGRNPFSAKHNSIVNCTFTQLKGVKRTCSHNLIQNTSLATRFKSFTEF